MTHVYTVTSYLYSGGESFFGIHATSAGADEFFDAALKTLSEVHGYKKHWDRRTPPDDEDFCEVREARLTLESPHAGFLDKRFVVKRWRLKP
jgi:hypothetical protein